jgi:hypothetical protein
MSELVLFDVRADAPLHLPASIPEMVGLVVEANVGTVAGGEGSTFGSDTSLLAGSERWTWMLPPAVALTARP